MQKWGVISSPIRNLGVLVDGYMYHPLDRFPTTPIVNLPSFRRPPETNLLSRGFSAAGEFGPLILLGVRRGNQMGAVLAGNPVTSDLLATAATGAIALGLLRFWEETAKRGIDKKLNRKLVHISVGLVFMLCWPLFSSGRRGAILAGLVPGINIIKMLLLGLGVLKDDASVKSMSRDGNHRELLKGPLYYALTITISTIFYWKSSPIGFAAICNLCAGDGLADVVGRRLGSHKLPYNKNKSFAGSIAMAVGGFLSSVAYMYYFSAFGYIRESWEMVLGFLIISLVTTVVESLPISTDIDDNLTVPITSLAVGSIFF